MAEGILAALDEFEADMQIFASPILTGNGGTFCSGMDLGGFFAANHHRSKTAAWGLSHYVPAKLLIAATEGYALAGGFELVLSCDMKRASRATKFGLPEVKRSLVVYAGGCSACRNKFLSASLWKW